MLLRLKILKTYLCSSHFIITMFLCTKYLYFSSFFFLQIAICHSCTIGYILFSGWKKDAAIAIARYLKLQCSTRPVIHAYMLVWTLELGNPNVGDKGDC